MLVRRRAILLQLGYALGMRTLLLIGILGFPLSVAASSSQPVYPKATIIDFGSDEFAGVFSAPEVDVIEGKRGRLRESLLKLRTHFRVEILTSLPK